MDEIQRVPQLASAIQSLVDANRRKCGQFILTGSHQPKPRETVTQSLAGRSTFLKLLPLTFSEMASTPKRMAMDADSLILRLQPYFANIGKRLVKTPARTNFLDGGRI